MAQNLLSVHGPATCDEALNHASEEDTKEALANVDAINERLREEGHWGFITDDPSLESREYISGSWVIEVRPCQSG